MKPPRLPDFQSVNLDPKTSALLLLDFTPGSCYRRAMCNASLPNVQGLLTKARNAGVSILYTVIGTRTPIREVANRTGENIITNDRGADKFHGTELEAWLAS